MSAQKASSSMATVTDISSGHVLLRFDGETAARTKLYKRLSSYTPEVGDRVYIVPMSGTYIVIGKVV